MAKESMKAREVKRQKLVEKYAEKKAALKKAALADADGNIDYEALTKLQKLPKNASKVRLHNRCVITGRPKGYMRQFGISRIQFREMASAGLREVSTSIIGEMVMNYLKELDEVAYVRFASVYREFKDVNTFVEEIAKLLKNNNGESI